jgi:hypothetical protein
LQNKQKKKYHKAKKTSKMKTNCIQELFFHRLLFILTNYEGYHIKAENFETIPLGQGNGTLSHDLNRWYQHAKREIHI